MDILVALFILVDADVKVSVIINGFMESHPRCLSRAKKVNNLREQNRITRHHATHALRRRACVPLGSLIHTAGMNTLGCLNRERVVCCG